MQSSFTGAPEQLWRFDQLADGSWRIMPKNIPNSKQSMVLTVLGSGSVTLEKYDSTSDTRALAPQDSRTGSCINSGSLQKVIHDSIPQELQVDSRPHRRFSGALLPRQCSTRGRAASGGGHCTGWTPVQARGPSEPMPPMVPADTLVVPSTPQKLTGADGFIQRWLILEPIPTNELTQNAVQVEVKQGVFS